MATANGTWLGSLSRDTVLATNRMVALAARGTGDLALTESSPPGADDDAKGSCTVLAQLHQAGLVEPGSNRSSNFRLARSPEAITLFDIASAVGEPFELCVCLAASGGQDRECSLCPLEHVSRSLQADVVALLKTRTLADVIPITA